MTAQTQAELVAALHKLGEAAKAAPRTVVGMSIGVGAGPGGGSTTGVHISVTGGAGASVTGLRIGVSAADKSVNEKVVEEASELAKAISSGGGDKSSVDGLLGIAKSLGTTAVNAAVAAVVSAAVRHYGG